MEIPGYYLLGLWALILVLAIQWRLKQIQGQKRQTKLELFWPPRARPGWRGAALMETDRMKRGDDVFPTIMDEGLVIETCLPATTDEWALYRRVYRVERHGRSWWRGTA